MRFGEAGAMAALLRIDDEIGLALAIERHILGAVAGDGAKAHLLEQIVELADIGRGVFDEFESVGAHRVFPEFCHDESP